MSHAAIAIPGLDRIGGAERQAILLAKGLRGRGWKVSAVALSGTGGAAAEELRDAGVAFVSLKMRKGLADLRGWVRFNRWLWRERPDVLHAHLPHAAWMARWSRLAAPVPVVIDTLHSSYAGGMGRQIGYRCSRWLADHVTAVSHATAESHLAAGMVSEDRLTVLGNGIDVDAWRPDAATRTRVRRALGLTEEFLWLAAGRLEAVKDFPALLAAMAGGPQTAQLVVLGEGPLRAELGRLAARLGLERRVRFAGFEPDVARWMQAADGFVLTSRYEGLPMVLLEAGACGVPDCGHRRCRHTRGDCEPRNRLAGTRGRCEGINCSDDAAHAGSQRGTKNYGRAGAAVGSGEIQLRKSAGRVGEALCRAARSEDRATDASE